MPQFDYTSENTVAQPSVDAQVAVTMNENRQGTEKTFFQSDGGGPMSATVRNTGANSIDAELRGSNFRPTELAIALWPVIVAAVPVAAAGAVNLEDDAAGLENYAVLINATVPAAQGAALVRFVQKAVG